jgi:hypothetical protein
MASARARKGSSHSHARSGSARARNPLCMHRMWLALMQHVGSPAPCTLLQARELEQKIMEHPAWESICKQQEDGRCHAPASFATTVYATKITPGEEEPLYHVADMYAALSLCQCALRALSCCHAPREPRT